MKSTRNEPKPKTIIFKFRGPVFRHNREAAEAITLEEAEEFLYTTFKTDERLIIKMKSVKDGVNFMVEDVTESDDIIEALQKEAGRRKSKSFRLAVVCIEN